MILGRKLGMTRVFLEQGYDCPVTVIQAGPCTVSQLKTVKNDGYNAIQIGYEETSETNDRILFSSSWDRSGGLKSQKFDISSFRELFCSKSQSCVGIWS